MYCINCIDAAMTYQSARQVFHNHMSNLLAKMTSIHIQLRWIN